MIFRTRFTNVGSMAGMLGSSSYKLGIRAVGDPTEILYHKLQIDISSNFEFSYSYMDGSGIYPSGNIIDFLTDLQETGEPEVTSLLYNMANDAPNIMVQKSCFVVIELHALSNLRFHAGYQAIDMQSPGLDTEYCSLSHIDTSWQESAGTSSPSEPSYLAYFGVDTPRESGDDPFNLYFQIDQSSSNTIYAAVDPKVKNRAGLGFRGHRRDRRRHQDTPTD